MLPGPHVEQPQHRLDGPRLAVGLVVPDPERTVVAGPAPVGLAQEPLPAYLAIALDTASMG